jgi:hypothetical protein
MTDDHGIIALFIELAASGISDWEVVESHSRLKGKFWNNR